MSYGYDTFVKKKKTRRTKCCNCGYMKPLPVVKLCRDCGTVKKSVRSDRCVKCFTKYRKTEEAKAAQREGGLRGWRKHLEATS